MMDIRELIRERIAAAESVHVRELSEAVAESVPSEELRDALRECLPRLVREALVAHDSAHAQRREDGCGCGIGAHHPSCPLRARTGGCPMTIIECCACRDDADDLTGFEAEAEGWVFTGKPGRIDPLTGKVAHGPTFRPVDVTGWSQDDLDLLEAADDAEIEAWEARTVPRGTWTCPDCARSARLEAQQVYDEDWPWELPIWALDEDEDA